MNFKEAAKRHLQRVADISWPSFPNLLTRNSINLIWEELEAEQHTVNSKDTGFPIHLKTVLNPKVQNYLTTELPYLLSYGKSFPWIGLMETCSMRELFLQAQNYVQVTSFSEWEDGIEKKLYLSRDKSRAVYKQPDLTMRAIWSQPYVGQDEFTSGYAQFKMESVAGSDLNIFELNGINGRDQYTITLSRQDLQYPHELPVVLSETFDRNGNVFDPDDFVIGK